MRTVIFILALSAVAAPALAVTTANAITCGAAGTAKFCNKCLATDDTPPVATDQCYDCMAGYYLTFGSTTDGVCNRCSTGTGIAAGTGANRPAQQQSQTSCTACHATCARCYLPDSAASCSKCALDTFTTANAVGGVAACSGTCTAGMTRAAGADSDFTATQVAETSTVCNVPCDSGCASCKGNAASGCTKCAVGKYATAWAAATKTATCTSACDAGTTRDVAAAVLAGNEDKATICVSCHATCADCKGTAATGCTKCKPSFYGTAWDNTAKTATCSSCPSGKTRTADGPALTTAGEESSVCNQDCHTSCASCKTTADTGCTKCAVGRYASDWAAASSTAKCSSECDAGKTRDVAAAVLAGNEDKATICVSCNSVCAECKGTAGTACTKCAAGHFLSARTGTEVVGTCTACGDGKGKDADAAIFTGTSATTTKEDGCKATCTAASNCGVCSAAKPDECLTCPTGKTLDAATKKCPATAGTGGSSASLVQALCGASLAAYALF